jgi:hypothetical protein
VEVVVNASKRATGQSASIVSFISKLLPLYIEELVDGVFCARSLRDGTLIRPVEEPPEEEDGRVEIWWQGDPAHSCEVQGIFVVRLGLSDYVAFHSRSAPQRYAMQMRQLVEHFELKTGRSLGVDDDDGMLELLALAGKLIKELGIQGAIEVLKSLG